MRPVNPELLRNLWLELTPQRLLLAPITFLLIFGTVALFTALHSNSSNLPAALGWTSAVLLSLLALWGASRSYHSIADEVRGETWDIQRLAALGAWTMTWGKLFGSTSFTWYCTLFCFPVFAISCWIQPDINTPQALMLFLLGVPLLHGTALLGSLAGAHNSRRAGAHRGMTFIGGILFFFIGTWILPHLLVVIVQASEDGALLWYDHRFDGVRFAILSLAVFLAWTLFGVYRLFRAELQYRVAPWAWLAFLVFCMAYGAGFISAGDFPPIVTVRLFSCFALALVAVYVNVFQEPKDSSVLRRVFQRARLPWMSADTPLWLVSLYLAAALAVLTGVMAAAEAGAGNLKIGAQLIGPGFLLPVILLAMAVRDTLLVLSVHASGRSSRRKDGTVLFYLAALYLLLPALASVVPQGQVVFFPWLANKPLPGLLIAVLWALAAGFVFLQCWRRINRQMDD